VLSCSGITTREMKSALDIRVPHSIPHVSRFRRVLGAACLRNSVRRVGGRKTVRRGLPFSR
jgi:hypothetical protein